MAYSEIYNAFFYYHLDGENTYLKISILNKDYAGSASELKLAKPPLIFEGSGNREILDYPIRSARVEIRFLAVRLTKAYLLFEDGSRIITPAGDGFEELEESEAPEFSTELYDEFLTADYKDFLIHIIADPLGTPRTEFIGYLDINGVNRQLLGYEVIYTLSATDGLNELKNFDYSGGPVSPYRDFANFLTIVKTCLSKIADISELQLNLRFQCNIYEAVEAAADYDPFSVNEAVQDVFFEIDDGAYNFLNCEEVLNQVLTLWFCTLRQSGGYYWIINRQEPESYFYQYDWDLIEQEYTANALLINIDDFDFKGKGSLYKLPPVKYLEILILSRFYGVDVLPNGTFDENITGWENGEAQHPPTTQDGGTLSWYDYPLIGGVLKLSVGPGAGLYSFHYPVTISMAGVGAGDIRVNWEAELAEDNRSGGESAIPIVRARLFDGSSYDDGSTGQRPFLTVGGFYSFSETFAGTVLGGTTIDIEIEVEIQDATTTSAIFYFDNITVRQDAEATPKDWFYKFTNTALVKNASKKIELRHADKFESIYEISAIKDHGGAYTAVWNRYGLTDGEGLIVLLGQQILNSLQNFRNHSKISCYDPNEEITFHSLIGFDGRTYEIIKYVKDYRAGVVELELIETFFTDCEMSYYRGKKLTAYGEQET